MHELCTLRNFFPCVSTHCHDGYDGVWDVAFVLYTRTGLKLKASRLSEISVEELVAEIPYEQKDVGIGSMLLV